MKKLMTSLLAVLLCGFTLCWAQPPQVSGTVTYEGMSESDSWTMWSVIFKNTSTGDPHEVRMNVNAETEAEKRHYEQYVDFGGGTYDLTFTGEANGKTYTYSENGLSITADMTKDIVATASAPEPPTGGATVTGALSCVPAGGGEPSNAGINGTVTLYIWGTEIAAGYKDESASTTYTIEHVKVGEYKAVFTGAYQGAECTGDTKVVVGENDESVTANIVANLSAPTPTTVEMSVFVGAEVDYYGSMQFQGIAGATVTCKQGENVIGTATTANGWNKGIATFTGITAGETYSFSVTANGYKDTTVTNVTGVKNDANERSAFKIGMREAFVTISGTLKVGETALTELPEGITLVIGADGTGYTAQISESGYTVECKAGSLTAVIADQISGESTNSAVNKNPAENYTVTAPEKGSITVPGSVETFTQDIVLTKNYAAVIGVDASDKLLDNELTLTKEGETDVTYKAGFLASPYPSNHFRFNKVEAGTYTLGCAKFGYKLKGEAPVVTVAADLADVTLSAPVEIEPLEKVTATWKGTVKHYAADGYTPVLVEGAAVALYARDKNGQKTGEPLATAKSAADGTYSISVTGELNAPYILEITHASIIPFTKSVNAAQAEDSPYGNFYALWASGQVVYDGDIASGKIEFTQNGSKVYSTQILFDPTNKSYAIGKMAAPNGSNYEISFEGVDGDKFVLNAKEENIDLSAGAVTKDLTAVKDEDKGYMTIRLRYKNPDGEIIALNNSPFTFDSKTYYTDADGNNSEILVEKGSTYDFAVAKNTYRGFDGATIEGINAFREIQGKMLPNDTTIYISGLEAEHIKLSGTVTMPEGVGEGVKVAVRTVRDLKVMSTPIVKEGDVYKYAFEDIPVAASGSMPIFLVEPDAKYNATYKVSVPYNYEVKAAANGNKLNVDFGMDAENTKNIEVVKIACNVSGTVSPAKQGELTLTKQGESKYDATYGYAQIVGQGNYKFQGVPAGTYTLTVNCAGYKTVTKEVTVAEELADVTVDAITLEAVPMTVTVSGHLAATNPYNRNYETFDGAKIAIYNGTEQLADTTLPVKENYGYIPSGFTFEATAGMKVLFKMEHPSIEPVSKEYTVTGTTLSIGASDLGYKFLDKTPDNKVAMTDFKAEWNANFDSLKLSWKWPEGADDKINTISLRRKLTAESGDGVEVKTWVKTGERNDTTYGFPAAELPVAYTDTVTQPVSYTYMFNIIYTDALHSRKTVTFLADMRDGTRYKLAYSVNDDKMGTLTSYSQPEGEYLEGDQITLTAQAKEGYKFVEFLKNGEKLSDAELAKLTLFSDTAAIYGFKMPAYDVTIKAVFASRSGNVDPETKEYTVTLQSSNEAWGKVSGGGKFEEGKEIEVKATVTDETKYEFVAWKEGDKVVSEDATYKFKVEKDITLTAVFKEKVANENLKAARWAIFAEDGAIVIKGINGDRYDIYDLNGHHCGAALCTGAEIRLNVAKSKLYIVRRLGADGSFDAKKIVVR